MDNFFYTMNSFFSTILIAIVIILAGLLWFIFEYWYIFIGVPLLLFIIFFVKNYKKIKEEADRDIERMMQENKLD